MLHFLVVWLLQAAAKVKQLVHSQVRFQNPGIYGIYNPQDLSGALVSLKRHSPRPSRYKFRISLCFEAYLLCKPFKDHCHVILLITENHYLQQQITRIFLAFIC